MVVKEALANSLKDAQDALSLENSLREKYQNPGAMVDKHFGYDSPNEDKERANDLHVHLCPVCKGEVSNLEVEEVARSASLRRSLIVLDVRPWKLLHPLRACV